MSLEQVQAIGSSAVPGRDHRRSRFWGKPEGAGLISRLSINPSPSNIGVSAGVKHKTAKRVSCSRQLSGHRRGDRRQPKPPSCGCARAAHHYGVPGSTRHPAPALYTCLRPSWRTNQVPEKREFCGPSNRNYKFWFPDPWNTCSSPVLSAF